MTQPALLAVLAVVGVLAVALAATALVLAARSARLLRADRDEAAVRLGEARREAADLRARLERVEGRAPASDRPAGSWLITDVGAAAEPEPGPVTVEPRLFADMVLRESVVRAAGLGHGLRRALSPEVRDQIRREMRREVRRARKQRKADVRDARRAWAAAERAREAA